MMNVPAQSLRGKGLRARPVPAIRGSFQPFIVSVHDVEPRFLPEIAAIVEALRTRVGASMTAAVVAEPAEHSPPGFASFVAERFEEIALHGYSHRSGLKWHPISLLTQGANEFSRLPEAEARERLRLGQKALGEIFGAPARVFVPPAWCQGPVTVQAAACEGLTITVSWRHLLTQQGRIPLATQSWDCGRLAILGYAGEWLGRLSAGVPCITFHPADVQRGFLSRGLKSVDRLLLAGLHPTTFESCVRQILEEPSRTTA